jgi:APA family basic amino acid/polyamine antiporter
VGNGGADEAGREGAGEFGLRRALGLGDLVAIEIGTTIGAGVFALTGVAASMTGAGVPLAYAIAAVPILLVMMTIAMLGSALPTAGGTYRYPSRLFSPGWAFLGVWIYGLGMVLGALPLYGETCAEYLRSLFPGLPVRPTAAALLTLFWLVNLAGVRAAARVQAAMVAVLVAALLWFAAAGLPEVDPSRFEDPLPHGVGGLLSAACLLTFTLQGANAVIELGAEIRDPGRNVPRSLLLSVPAVAALYVLVAVVAVGVAGGKEIRDLTDPARAVLGEAGWRFFVAGGAVLAITTTINATFLWATRSMMVVARDGLLPQGLAATSRCGTPARFLTVLWAGAVLALLAGWLPLRAWGGYPGIGGNVIFVPVMASALLLRRRAPEALARAPFRLRGALYWLCPAVGMALSAAAVAMLAVDLGRAVWPLLGWTAAGVVVYLWRTGRLGGRGGAERARAFRARLETDREALAAAPRGPKPEA